jgi:hypothetical protein
LILAAFWGVYFASLHPWLMNWGATPAERGMALPGDELLPDPSRRFTRAITIQAPATEVWRWVVQIGQDRAGFYSNTWLENLTGANIHNASQIRPEWQTRSIGDRVPLARADLFGGAMAATARTQIVALQPERMIANIPGRFVLQPLGGATRVLLREAVPSTWFGRLLTALAWDPVHFVMQQRMLRGIKERAEHRPLIPPAMSAIARAGWILGGIGLVALFLTSRRYRLWILLPLATALPIIRTTGDFDAALAAFLAVGITVVGGLAFGIRRWPLYLLLASSVAFVLLLSPDAYTSFGLTFLAAGIALPIRSPGL